MHVVTLNQICFINPLHSRNYYAYTAICDFLTAVSTVLHDFQKVCLFIYEHQHHFFSYLGFIASIGFTVY